MANIGISVKAEVVDQYESLDRKYCYIQIKLFDDKSSAVVDKVVKQDKRTKEEEKKAYDEFLKQLPSGDCRYVVYNYHLQIEGNDRIKRGFIRWCPVKFFEFYQSKCYQREKNREALRALKNSTGEISLLMGSFFIKVDSKDATKLISKKQEKVSNDIETTRRLLSEKVRHLRDVEKQPDCDWFDLKPLSRDELRRTCVHADDLLNLQK